MCESCSRPLLEQMGQFARPPLYTCILLRHMSYVQSLMSSLLKGPVKKGTALMDSFLQSSPLHIHTFDLHQDNTCLLLFKNGAAFRITVTSTEETKLCLHHLCFWPNICCLIYLLFHIFFIMSLSHFWSAFLISDKWSFGPSHHQQARPLPLIKL